MHLHLCVALVAALVLNEVLYDPEGPDGGHEFVELLNTSDSPVVLEMFELQVGDGANPGSWRTAWRAVGDTLAPWVPFVIGGDSVATRSGALELTLQNGPDAVRLWHAGDVVDVLGYGDLSHAGLFESRPAPDVSGVSLARLPDGRDRDDNALDWFGAPPSPGRRNQPQRDWRLQWIPHDPTRMWPFRELTHRARLHNRGTRRLDSDAWQLTAWLQHIVGEPYVDGWVRGARQPLPLRFATPALAAGDSLDFEVRWLSQPGLVQLEVLAAGADEDSTNNRIVRTVRVGPGDVVVHEILFAPRAGEAEWIELHNRGERSHDLNGWTVADATGKPGRLRATSPLRPGDFALLSADPQSAVAGLASEALRASVTPWPSLNNSDGTNGIADHVVLRDPHGIVQDAVFYRAAWAVVPGRSIERLTLDPDARGLLWATSKDPGGATPGRRNSTVAMALTHVGLRLHPNPFSPDADGVDDLTTAAFEVPAGASGFEASIFDTQGRRRRWLAADRLGPGPRRIPWDGTDDRGVDLSEGVYLFHLEFLGKHDAVTKRCIGLVRGGSRR